MLDAERFKVVVVGDSGVGKTALVHLLCHQQPLLNPCYTVGCSLDMKVHHCSVELNQKRPLFVELWDIGGSNAHVNTRSVFYQGTNGLLLVYDCTNAKSQVNLRKWLTEVIQKTPYSSLESINQNGSVGSGGMSRMANIISSYWSQNEHNRGTEIRLRAVERTNEEEALRSRSPPDSSQLQPSRSLPVLVVGTKADLLDSSSKRQIQQCFKQTPLSSLLDDNIPPLPTSSALSSSNGWHSSMDISAQLRTNAQLTRSTSNDSLRPTASTNLTGGGGGFATSQQSVHVNLERLNVPTLTRNSIYRAGDKCHRFAADMGLPEVILSCNSTASIAPNSWNAVLLDKFFDDVVANKLSNTAGFSPEVQLKSRKGIGASGILTGVSCRTGADGYQ